MALSSSKRMWAGNLESPLWFVDNTKAMMVSVSCSVQYKQLIICTVECTVLHGLAKAHFANQIMSMQNAYIARLMPVYEPLIRSSWQNDVRLRAIKRSREECQTYHCQHNSMNIGDKSQTEKIGWSIKTKPIVAKPKAKTEDNFKTIVITITKYDLMIDYQIWKYIIQSLTSLMTVHFKGH
jgi:hypothetical protein